MTTIRRRAIVPITAFLLLASACGTAATPSPTAVETASPSPTPAATATANPTASPNPAPTPAPDTTVADAWSATATQHRAMIGEQFEYDCPADGVADSIWGTDLYTDDSSVCTAAVHVGLITIDDGGTVTIEMRAGEDEYEASERNGITSFAYPAWGGSFVIIDD